MYRFSDVSCLYTFSQFSALLYSLHIYCLIFYYRQTQYPYFSYVCWKVCIFFRLLLCTFTIIKLINIQSMYETRATQSVAYSPGDLDLWPWKSIGFQILLRTKHVTSLVKIHWRMLILECSQECYGRTDGRTDGSVSIFLRNFVGEGIIKGGNILPENKAYGDK